MIRIESTLLKLLAFLESPQQGQILFNGYFPTQDSLLSLRRQVALVAQKPYLLKGTVLQNVLLGLKFRSIPTISAKKLAVEALEQVGLSAFLDRKVSGLSGGEAQKVALARALALQPEVLLLDEPFSHLDQKSTEYICRLITNFSLDEGKTVIFSTHDRLLATTVADKNICLVAGGLVDFF